jgi:hypothetical protein
MTTASGPDRFEPRTTTATIAVNLNGYGGSSMSLTFRSLLLLIAVILFVLAAVGIDVAGISLVALGLACFAGSFVVPETALGSRR